MPTFPVGTFHNHGSAIGCAAMVGGIARETGSRDKGDEAGIRTGLRIPVSAPSMDRRFGSPEIVVILVEECRYQAVIHRHVYYSQSPSIFGERMPLFPSNLLDGLIEDLSWRGRRVEKRDIRAIWWSLGAVNAPYRHHFVVGFRVSVARERR